jgi:hypothetical protein
LDIVNPRLFLSFFLIERVLRLSTAVSQDGQRH